MKQMSFEVTISALDAETLALSTATIAWSDRRYRRGVSGDIGDCRVGITPQMRNRVTNHGDMSTFSKPAKLYYNFTMTKENVKELCTHKMWTIQNKFRILNSV